jgi:hypothetical protein
MAPQAAKTNPINDLVDTVKAYALQETVGPLKDVGRFLAMGAAGAISIGVGVVMLLVALLRILQTETNGVFDGNWSFVPYLITVAVGVLVVYITLTRIQKHGLDRPRETR